MRFLSRLLHRTATVPDHPALRSTCSAAPTIRVHSSHGDVTIQTHDQLEILVAFDDLRNTEPLGSAGTAWSFDPESNTFVLTQAHFDAVLLRHSDMTLWVPTLATLELQSAGGDIRLTGHYADVRIQSAGGDIETVDAVTQQLHIESAGGDVDIVVNGTGHIQSHGGDIDVAVLGESMVTIETAGGDIDVDIHAPCTVTATTHGGDIDIQIDKGYETDVDASTTVGDINSDIVFNAGGESDTPIAVALMLRTHAGDIRIRQG